MKDIKALGEGALAGVGICALSLSIWGGAMMQDPNLYGAAFAVTCAVGMAVYIYARMKN